MSKDALGWVATSLGLIEMELEQLWARGAPVASEGAVIIAHASGEETTLLLLPDDTPDISNHSRLSLKGAETRMTNTLAALRQSLVSCIPCLDHPELGLDYRLRASAGRITGAKLALAGMFLFDGAKPIPGIMVYLQRIADRLSALPAPRNPQPWLLDSKHILYADDRAQALVIHDALVAGTNPPPRATTLQPAVPPVSRRSS